MNISELLARNARKYPDREAVVDGECRITYAELDQTVNALANSLLAQGIGTGDKVVLYSPNCKEFIYSYFAVLRTGAIVVPINARLTAHEVSYIIQHCEARAFIAHEAIFSVVEPLANDFPLIWLKTGQAVGSWQSLDLMIREGEPTPVICQTGEDDEATILYTSGTTGKPKGVLFTNRNILTVATMICIEMNVNVDSCMLHMMPLSHSAPLHLFFMAGTYVGAKHVLASAFRPDLLLELVSREQTTHFFGAPIAYLMTANHPEVHSYNLSSMRYWVYGGAPLGTQEVSFIQTKLRTNQLMCVYGLTEAGPNGTLLQPEEHAAKAGSIGKRAALNCELRIVNDQGEEVAAGEVGEIILAGEGTMKEYYRDPQETAQAIRGGWLYTGDMARRDEDGYIWVVDRKKDMIISGGQNVYPKEIEDCLREHPDILDVAVVGIPHPEWGETVKAVIVWKEPGKQVDPAAECKRFLYGKLADYKIPKLYQAVTELPRNATGKILKTQLRG